MRNFTRKAVVAAAIALAAPVAVAASVGADAAIENGHNCQGQIAGKVGGANDTAHAALDAGESPADSLGRSWATMNDDGIVKYRANCGNNGRN